jgi:transposase
MDHLGSVCKMSYPLPDGTLRTERHAMGTLAPLLPPQRNPGRDRPAKDHRVIVNAIFRRLSTGVPWRDLPEQYGSWRTSTLASGAGSRPGSRSGCLPRSRSRPTPPASWTRSCTSSMAAPCAPTSTPLGPKRGRRSSPRPLTRRLLEQDPSPRRGTGPANDHAADRGAAR